MQIKNKKLNCIIFSYFLLILFLIFSSFSEEINPNSYNYIKLEIDNQISFKTNIETKYEISEFDVFSYFFPITYNGSQYLNSYETTHKDYVILNDSENLYLNFKFDENTLQKNNLISNKFVVEKNIHRPKIKNKVDYPITNINSENTKYLEFSGLIDYDENIKIQASTLANGESDVFIIASKSAKWIREDINYNLSTVTLNPNQKSSDVFKSKSGVCKEITNLYVSMMRSIGIPARVVSGYAYTNSEEIASYVGSNWGGHAWAEVLIGDTWVPFDLTYNQYGYVDATHLVLDKSVTSQSNGVLINASGYGFSLNDKPNMNNEFKILEMKGNLFDEGFNIDIEGPQEIGFESYGYIKVTAENKEDFYKILFLKVAKANEVELLDSSEKMTIFSPYEKKEIYFRYQIPSSLDSDYIYTFPFLIYNEFSSEQYNVTVRKDFLKIKQIALPKEEKIENIYSNNKLEWNCNFILDSVNNIILCSIKNPNNYEITNMNVCISTKCEKVDLKLNEIKSITFDTNNTSEKISYIYEKENGEFTLSAVIPSLDFKYNYNENILYLNYTILNYIPNLKVNIYINNNLTSSSNYEENELNLNLIEGNNTIRYELMIKDKVLQNEIIDTIYYEKKTFIESPVNTTKTWIESILTWIKNLF